MCSFQFIHSLPSACRSSAAATWICKMNPALERVGLSLRPGSVVASGDYSCICPAPGGEAVYRWSGSMWRSRDITGRRALHRHHAGTSSVLPAQQATMLDTYPGLQQDILSFALPEDRPLPPFYDRPKASRNALQKRPCASQGIQPSHEYKLTAPGGCTNVLWTIVDLCVGRRFL